MSRYAVSSYLEAEVRCFHCGHTSGAIRRDQGVPGARAYFHAADGSHVAEVRSLTQLRCMRCSGSVFIDEFETRYVYPKVDFLDDDKPRRGRPPKRLVELRRAREEAAREEALRAS
jgi:DNA-directed RNA polymerase subunit RPC12/RpoP